jgi:hypothetical protein
MTTKAALAIVGADEEIPRLITGYKAKGCAAEVALVLRPRDGRGLMVLQEKKGPARVWQGEPAGSDAPRSPTRTLSPTDAVALVRDLKANVGAKGPAGLKGLWKGALHCEGDAYTIELERKVVSYGTLRLRSSDAGWTATFSRKEQWFGAAREESVGPRARLAEAIQQGLAQMQGLVGEACSFRDSHRRIAVDPAFAQTAPYPYREPTPPRDRTEQYSPRESFEVVQTAAGYDVVNLGGAVVASFGSREKGKAQKHAAGLSRGQAARGAAPPPAPMYEEPATPPSEAPPPLSSLPAPESPACPVSVARIADATQKEADALIATADSLWGTTEAPELLQRAGKLIRRAEALVGSPLCTGAAKEAARDDLRRAAEAYNTARAAILRGDDPDTITTLKSVAERVGLAAARAAKACAAPAAPAPRRPNLTVAPPPAPETPMPPPSPAPPPARTPRRRASADPAPPPDVPAVDPAKDAALIAAFAEAIQGAAAAMGGGA